MLEVRNAELPDSIQLQRGEWDRIWIALLGFDHCNILSFEALEGGVLSLLSFGERGHLL